MSPLCKSCRHKVGARHAPWCAIGNLDGPVLASECGDAVYQRHADGPLLPGQEVAGPMRSTITLHARKRWEERIAGPDGRYRRQTMEELFDRARRPDASQRQRIQDMRARLGKKPPPGQFAGSYLLARSGVVFVVRAPRTVVTVYFLRCKSERKRREARAHYDA